MKYLLPIIFILSCTTKENKLNNISEASSDKVETSRIDIETRKKIYYELATEQEKIRKEASETIYEEVTLMGYQIAPDTDGDGIPDGPIGFLEPTRPAAGRVYYENFADFTQTKFEELKINLKKKYNITDSEYYKIMYEGANERWPFKSSF